MSKHRASESSFIYWLKILAAVGIPFALLYLAVASLVNPQFAELRELIASNRELISSNRELISSNREAIAANASSIERLEAKVDSSVEKLDSKIDSSVARLEARIDLVIEVLIIAFTNENITEAELRNLLNAGEE